jgi:hypothetical protein
MAFFENSLYYLEQWGLTDVILPFILIFTIIFATLQKAKLFGADSKKYNIIFSLAISLLVVIPHVTGKYPPGADVIEIMNEAIPSVSVIAIAIIMFLVLIGIFGAEAKWGGWMSGLVLLFSLIAVTWIFGKAAGWWGYMPFFLADPDIQALIVIILVFGIIVWFVTAEPGGKGVWDSLKEIGEKAFK